MASTIKIKRSAGANAPTFDEDSGSGKVAAGELAWVHGTGGAGSLYVGSSTGSAVEVIGGKPGSAYCQSIFANTPLTGTTTAAALNATGAITCAGFTPTGAINLTGGTTTVAAPSADTHAATKKYVDDEVAGAAPDMNAISDTALSSATDCPQASILIWDTDSNKWEDQRITGNVSVNKDGTSAITSYPAGSIDIATDSDGTGFVKELTAVNNQTAVTPTATATGVSVAVGLAAAITTPGNLTVGGNLVVNGSTTEVKTSTIELEDPVFVLGENASTDAHDRGIQIKWNDGAAKTGFFGMDRSDAKFKFYSAATFNAAGNQVTGGTLGKLAVLEVEGTIKTAAQNDITSATSLAAVGTIATGVWNGTAIAGTHGGTGLDTSQGANQSGVVTVDGSGGYVVDKGGLDASNGGTGLTSYAAGDMVYATGATTLQKLAKGTAGQMMVMNNGATAPVWTSELDGGTF